MKTQVIFYSMTGNSKKIANAIASSLSITADNIKNYPVVKDVDLLFIVGGIYSGKSHPNLLNYVATLKPEDVKRVVLITSSCGGVASQKEIRSVLRNNRIEVANDEFLCFGNFLFIKMGRPNKAEIADAVKFAQSFVE